MWSITKHNVVLRVSMHISLIQVGWENLDVATATVDLLLMFDSKLNYQGLALIAEWFKTSRRSIKTSILACLKT